MKDRIFKIVTGVVGIYNVALGGLALILPIENVVSLVEAMKGYSLEVTSQLPLILKFTSAYLLAFGGMMLLLSSNPLKYRLFALPALAVFGIRFVINILFLDSIAPNRTSESINVLSLGLLLFFFLSILFTMPKKQTDS